MRPSGRKPDELRAVSFERGFTRHAEGSCLVRFGDTHVLCTASLEESVPPWLKGGGKGWVTAEYGMLPRATHERTRREARPASSPAAPRKSSASSAAACAPSSTFAALGERQITLDCDVLQADGGTRTAAITGSWVALFDCLKWMEQRAMFKQWPLKDHVAAISCGIHGGRPRAGPRLPRGFLRRNRRQFRDDGLGRHRRDPGHGGRRALLARHACTSFSRWPRRASANWWPSRRRPSPDAGDPGSGDRPLWPRHRRDARLL